MSNQLSRKKWEQAIAGRVDPRYLTAFNRYPSVISNNLGDRIKGAFSTQSGFLFPSGKTPISIIQHEGLHGTLRKRMEALGITLRDREDKKEDESSQLFNKNFGTAAYKRNYGKNRDLEKTMGILGYRGNPHKNTMFQPFQNGIDWGYPTVGQGKYYKTPQGSWTYEEYSPEDIAKYKNITDGDFEHSLVYYTPTTEEKSQLERKRKGNRLDPFLDYRQIRSEQLIRKLLNP